jgi:DNA-binding CsgD family transcriptional regulator
LRTAEISQGGAGVSDHGILVDRIYEAAAVPECWPEVLDRLAHRVAAFGGVMLVRRCDAWTGWRLSPCYEESFHAYLNDGIDRRSQSAHRLLAADYPGFLTVADIYTPEEWRADPLYADWAVKWGLDQAAATAIPVSSGELLIFYLQRRAGEPAFGKDEVALLDGIRPHLARAGLLAARLRLERLRAAAEAMALIGLPTLIVDGSARVLAANSLIGSVADHLRWLPKDRVGLVDPAAERLLRRSLSGLSGAPDSAGRSFAARSKTGARTAVIHVIPTPGQARDIFDGGEAVLVITPVALRQAPDAALIRSLFDLTPREARVARGIAQGLSIEDIARRCGVERETIRSQVKAVFAKTGTHRQSEVASLLAGLTTLSHQR